MGTDRFVNVFQWLSIVSLFTTTQVYEREIVCKTAEQELLKLSRGSLSVNVLCAESIKASFICTFVLNVLTAQNEK